MKAGSGCELDLDRFMVVAVPRLQYGRHGKQGLEYIQRRLRTGRTPIPPPTRNYEAIEAVIGHEYFPSTGPATA